MQIRVGYDLIYDCPQPTPMALMLNIHHTRAGDIVVPDRMTADPFVPITSYRDGFGNWCTRIVAPAGRVRLSANALLNDTGRARSDRAGGVPACRGRSPGGVARLPARQPLLRDRSADRHRLGPVRQLASRRPAHPGDLRLRPSPHRVRLPGCPIDENGLGGAPGGQRRVPRLRPPGDRLLPLHEHPGPLLHRLSRRHRRLAGPGPDGFRRLVRGLYRRALAHLRRAEQQAAHRPRPDRPRTGCDGRGDQQHVRSQHPRRLHGLGGRGEQAPGTACAF